ncbi:MAG: homoserine dehydrogenase [Candidatus Omnitrophica bacterium]|nr:homoserine dehydrogenase [Candidatus Omnitrophota bacterium]
MKSVNIGIIGLGTIGMGVYDAIKKNGSLIAKKTGVSVKVIGVADKDKKVLKGIKGGKALIKTSSPRELIANKDIDIIVELIGGIKPAKDIVLEALKNKKHVVTANKELISKCWREIFSSARKNKVFVDFEASVGGVIPIIRTIRTGFRADKIDTVYGILNGTTNFILTEIAEKACSFSEALKLAQKKGFAEKDPELDISGKDSAHKLAILTLLSFGQSASPDDIFTEGINRIEAQDLINAKMWGYSIKLLAIAKKEPKGLQIRVHPTLISARHLLSDVKGTDNAVFVKGELIGESLLFGKGAGRKPTSVSVVGDIIEIAEHIAHYGKRNLVPYNLNYAAGNGKLRNINDIEIPFYLRFSAIDKPGVLAGIASILSKYKISIANVSQEERKAGQVVPVVILTHKAKEGNMQKAIKEIDKKSYVKKKTVVIRIEG